MSPPPPDFALLHFLAAFVAIPVGLYLVWLFAIAFHECGHVVGALLVRYRIQSIHIGPIVWRRTYLGFRAGPAGGLLVSSSGAITARPCGRRRHLRLRTAIFVAAGPLASLATALACFGLSVVATAGDEKWLALFGVVNVAAGMMAAIPSEKSALGRPTDGAQLLSLFRRRSRVLLTWEIALTYSRAIEKLPPDAEAASLDDLIERAKSFEPVPGTVSTGVLALALDAGRFDLAKSMLAAALEAKRPVAGSVGTYLRNAAVVAALEEQKPDALRAFLQISRATARSPQELVVLEAVLHASLGHDDAARSSLKEWPQFLASVRDSRTLEFDMRWIVRMLEARLAAAEPRVVGIAAG